MVHRTDIAIVGAGIAGATLAAAIGDAAKVLLIEGEDQPGYHATGRSAAFWSQSYGGPAVEPLTTASLAPLSGYLSPRGCLHVADEAGEAKLDRLAADFAESSLDLVVEDRAGLEARVPGLAPAFCAGLWEASCQDIDVAALHAASLAEARRAGAMLRAGTRVIGVTRSPQGWTIATSAGEIAAKVIVDAAGAWASTVARLAGATPLAIVPHRRTVVQLAVAPAPAASLPLVMDAAGRFYFKPEAGRLWLSPHDETPVDAHDVAPEELDVAIAIDRLEHIVDWRILRRERAWAGLRSFAPDRAPIYGFDSRVPGFFWFAGQGGFGIQTAPAAAAIGAALLLEQAMPDWVSAIDIARYAPGRFA